QVVGDMELYFQNCMAVIMKLLGFYVDVERHTSNGRIDIVVKTQDYIYVMELKLDDTVEAALRQIEEKGYALPYTADSRTLYKIGISFSSKTRRLEDWRAVR
ncbi:MAG: PD-(D/E)XK nuclease domain-containing protein, partial [Bacteroidaceae bacterium]|nr:PD-(D/E)XK nuclease domain-containing protein [Bacteroidaceae bacterium]